MIVAASSIQVTVGEVAAALVLVAIAAIASAPGTRRPRGGHRHRGGPVPDPADGDRLRDHADLRSGLGSARPRADHGDGRVRRVHGAPPRQAGSERFLAASPRTRGRGRGDAGPGGRPRNLPGDAALPGARGRHGDRQLDDGSRGRAQPARRGRPRPVAEDRGDSRPRRDLLAGGAPPWSNAACGRG